MIRRFIVLVFLAAARFAFAQGGPPLLTDDPGTVDDRHWEINLGTTAEIHDDDVRDFELPLLDLNYGWGDHTQLKFEIPWLLREANGETQTEAGDGKCGVKWRFRDQSRRFLDVSTYPQLSFNSPGAHSIEDRGLQMLLPLEIAKTVGKLELNWEVGYNIKQHQKDEWLLGFATGYRATPKLELLVEVHAIPDRTFSEDEFVFQAGGRRKLAEHFVLLFAFGRGLPGSSPSQPAFIGYAGLQLLLGGKTAPR
jgi:hypothetical protein